MYVYGYDDIWNIDTELLNFSIYFLYSSVIGLANYWVVYELDQRLSWKESPKKRAVYGVIGSIVVSMIAVALLRIFSVLIIEQKSWSFFIKNENAVIYFFSLIITLIVVLALYVIYFYKEITKQTITEHQSIAKTEIAKYESLKSQIDPHFLFNSLNVLTSLIEENPEQAERFTSKLSKVYRYVLEQKEKTLVPLQEELDFAKLYMELLRMRFENAINFTIPDQASNSDYKIVPLSLQLLLENAIKHNAISEGKPLHISIKEKNGYLVIENNLNIKKTLKKGIGIGLQNIKERYALITEKQVVITKNDTLFKIVLPLLTQKSKIMKSINHKEENKYYEAKKQVEKIKSFYGNLVAYLIFNIFIVIVNYKTGWEHKWFIYPMIGWGIGVLFHYFDAFGYYPFLSKDWEEKKIAELMKEKQKEMWE
jgi:sensor histidine kinase YesM